ncbi:MAG: 16S rRNA (uracil(1498)-N(3))-methyltransferase [Bacteroidota bacterium]|nr:16S rRNA (uracil(1498)-N(3))-methyltransferase [Bacteroidota bacterium]
MALFYTPDIETDPCLSEEESVHCVRVLRMQLGDEIGLIDGKGHFYKAVITEAHPKHCRVNVLEMTPDTAGPFYAHIAMCPTKNPERVEWFIEKATEVGIGGFAFIRSRFSERKTVKTERLDRVIVSALKQSVKALKPTLQELTDFNTFVKQPFDGQKFICHCNPGKKPLLNTVCLGGSPVLVLIGPEGDFSVEEVALAEANGFVSVSLGDTRLRTETAAFVAAHIVQLKNMTD